MIMANEAVARIGACHPFYRTPPVVHNPDKLWFIVVAEDAESVTGYSPSYPFSCHVAHSQDCTLCPSAVQALRLPLSPIMHRRQASPNPVPPRRSSAALMTAYFHAAWPAKNSAQHGDYAKDTMDKRHCCGWESILCHEQVERCILCNGK